eukprot:jgi/Botrbrau1/1589/Bobra.0185s0010.1
MTVLGGVKRPRSVVKGSSPQTLDQQQLLTGSGPLQWSPNESHVAPPKVGRRWRVGAQSADLNPVKWKLSAMTKYCGEKMPIDSI